MFDPIVAPVPFAFPFIVTVFVALLIVISLSYDAAVGLLDTDP